jgi:hypothetical protein
VFNPVPDEEEYYGLAVRPDGRIVAQAWTAAGMALRVFDANGNTDPAFGENGRVLMDLTYAQQLRTSGQNSEATYSDRHPFRSGFRPCN